MSLGLGLLRLPLPSDLCFPFQRLLSSWCLCWGLALGLVFLLAWLCHQAGISKRKQEERDTAPFFPPWAGQEALSANEMIRCSSGTSLGLLMPRETAHGKDGRAKTEQSASGTLSALGGGVLVAFLMRHFQKYSTWSNRGKTPVTAS